MGTAGDLGPHQGCLRVEAIGIDPLQIIPPLIVIAVTGGGGKMGSVDAVFLHSGKHLALVVLRHCVDLPESLRKTTESRLAKFINGLGDPQLPIHFVHHDSLSSVFCRIS